MQPTFEFPRCFILYHRNISNEGNNPGFYNWLPSPVLGYSVFHVKGIPHFCFRVCVLACNLSRGDRGVNRFILKLARVDCTPFIYVLFLSFVWRDVYLLKRANTKKERAKKIEKERRKRLWNRKINTAWRLAESDIGDGDDDVCAFYLRSHPRNGEHKRDERRLQEFRCRNKNWVNMRESRPLLPFFFVFILWLSFFSGACRRNHSEESTHGGATVFYCFSLFFFWNGCFLGEFILGRSPLWERAKFRGNGNLGGPTLW